MKKYLFLDIDGTLYSGKTGRVPSSALDAIEQARRNGSMVFLCTGRSKAEASRYLDYPVDGFVFGSGSRCEVNGNVIYDHPIKPETVELIADLIRESGMGVLLGGNKGSYLDEVCWNHVKNYFCRPDVSEETKRREMEENGFLPMTKRDLLDPIYKLGSSKPHDASFEPLIEKIPSPFRLVQTLSSPEGDFGDISDGSIMKRDGIRAVMEYLHGNMDDTVGVGDSGNDIDMLEFCGIGIAMGNGTPEAKAAADWVTDDIDEDGLKKAFLLLDVI